MKTFIEVSSKYGFHKEKSQNGKASMSTERTTFIIGKDGLIKKIFPKVKVDGHIEEVIEALESLT